MLVVVSSFSVVWAQEAKKDNPPQERPKLPAALADSEAVLKRWQANTPSTLAEAHAALERLLSPETLADIDAMPTEGCMIEYHMSLGLNMRNGWGLWAGSPLAKYMQGLGNLLGSGKTDQSLSVSAVTVLPDDTVLLASNTGLYRLKGNELVQELAFAPDQTTDSSAGVPQRRNWSPNTVLVLDEQSYVIGCDSGGVYLLRQGNDGQWSFPSLEEETADPVVW